MTLTDRDRRALSVAARCESLCVDEAHERFAFFDSTEESEIVHRRGRLLKRLVPLALGEQNARERRDGIDPDRRALLELRDGQACFAGSSGVFLLGGMDLET